MKSFLMLGQSNMAGRGDFGEVPVIKNPLTFMLRNGKFISMSEPVNPDRSVVEPFIPSAGTHSGVCLAASFADEYAKRFNEKVGLIPCADGGSSLDDWAVGGLLYDHAVFQAKLAARSAELVGILWHQGEAECGSAERAGAYKEKFLKIINGIRGELGAPALPVVLGELGDFVAVYKNGVKEYFHEVNHALGELAAENSEMAIASAKGLVCRRDGIHFTSASLREFGKRYFDSYLTLV